MYSTCGRVPLLEHQDGSLIGLSIPKKPTPLADTTATMFQAILP